MILGSEVAALQHTQLDAAAPGPAKLPRSGTQSRVCGAATEHTVATQTGREHLRVSNAVLQADRYAIRPQQGLCDECQPRSGVSLAAHQRDISTSEQWLGRLAF